MESEYLQKSQQTLDKMALAFISCHPQMWGSMTSRKQEGAIR